MWLCLPAVWRVCWWHMCRIQGLQDLLEVALVLWWCVPSFCPLSRFVFGVLALNMVLFRVFRAFLAGFGRFVWVCVVLVRCVACVALYACGVRRFYGLLRVCLPFVLLPLSFCLSFYLFASAFCPSPCLLCSGCLLLVLLHCLCGSLGVVVVSFSLSDYTQKERARRFFPCVLSCPIVGLLV